MTDRETVAAGLRQWARGMYATEAAVELLIRAYDGRLLSGAWVHPEGDRWWFDADATADAGYLSGGELRVLDIAASLASTEQVVSLSHVLSGLDRATLNLVLAAVAHAGGSHEHHDTHFDLDAGTYTDHGPLPSAHPWPGEK